MMQGVIPAIFECVYYFDGGLEDFVLAGIFTRRIDAEECQKTLEGDGQFNTCAIVRRTLAALQKEFLDGAIRDAKRVVLHSGGLPVSVARVEKGEPRKAVTLTVAEIVDLAHFAGLVPRDDLMPTGEELEVEIEVRECPADGVFDDEEQRKVKTRFIALMAECPDEGCYSLGPEFA